MPRILAHHAEAIDPDLWNWIQHQIDSITGFGPATIVILIGALILIVPIAIVILAARRRRAFPVRNRPTGNR